jgi:3-hydroxybutyryl-CoA dehydratase
MAGKKINELIIGEECRFTKTISEYDVYNFAGITGDFNAVHIDKEYAKKTIFKDRIAHGILSAGLISAVIGSKLPGEGTIYLSQSTKFLKPVYFGDTITAIVTVIGKEIEKNKVLLKTECINQDGDTIVVGESTVLAPR